MFRISIKSKYSTLLISLLFTIFSFVFVNGQKGDIFCPEVLKQIPNVCERVKCFHNITKEDCPPETFYMERLTMCNCCPGCAKYISNGIGPDPKGVGSVGKCVNATKHSKDLTRIWEPECEGPFCSVQLNQCMPGLDCDETTGLCSLPTRTLEPCSEECLYKKTLKKLGMYHWDPECEEDGSYAPKQCKGDFVTGLCYCADSCGKRIFGSEFRAKAANQTCACSRQVNNLRKIGNIATMHCSSEGNFEALQCDTDSGICYCVEEKTGRMSGAVVPQNLWKTLPCFTQNVTNFMKDGRYLRKCESQYSASSSIVKDGKIHGTEVILRSLNCDYDGSYGHLQVGGIRTECVYKNGTVIKDFFIPSIADGGMDCNCARDEFLYQITGRPFSFQCAGQTGNYKTYYDFGSYASCVDRDGIPYGDLVPSKYACCLDKTCIPVTGQKCYSELNKRGYRGCCNWPYGGPCAI